ncbi:MAG: mandelate racemase/muconate lactonizing enzyme family protein [Acidobacteriia bacterium]|nr:mandelate racemase/muconate lactonizing enzyme family protein [Terriglobia bacterium]
MFTRRDLMRMALAVPAGSWLAHYEALAAPARGAVKITAVKALQLDFQTDGCLVRIETDAGITGYGETGVDAKMARARIPQYRLVGQDPLSIERHFQNMTGAIHPFLPCVPLISGLDIALWDLAGKILDIPVYKLMGGPQRDAVPMYSHGDFLKDMLTPASCKEWAQMIREQPEGFTAYKIEPTQALRSERVGPGITTAQLAKVAKGFANVREAVGDSIDIAVHCHNQYDTPSAIAVSRATEQINPLFIEDLSNSVEYSEAWMAIKRATRTPMLTGEKLELLKQYKPFVDNQAVDIIHPDISYAGGVSGCRKISDYAMLYRTPMALHNIGSLVRTYASVHLAAAIPNFYRSECRLGRPGRVYEKMALNQPPVIRNSNFQLPTGPGLGLEIDPAYMREHTPKGEDWA